MNRFQEKEVWESGRFEVDEQGRVWRKTPKRRAEHKLPSGYFQIKVMVNGLRYYTCAHRLVWHVLKGPIPSGFVINHKNGIKGDNRPENLEVVSSGENLSHAHRIGLVDQSGQRNPAAKLSNWSILEIRSLYADGSATQAALAARYGVAFQTISKIVRGSRRINQAGPVANYTYRRSPKSRELDGSSSRR